MAQKVLKTIDGLKLAEEDVPYFNDKLPPSFSIGDLAARNQAVINLTVKKYKAYLAKKQKAYDDGLMERTEALAFYFKHLNKSAATDTPVEKYFGRKTLAKLRGRKIMSTIFKAANGQKGLILGESDDIIY